MNTFSVSHGVWRLTQSWSLHHGNAASSKGIWSWETALTRPVRFLGQHLSQPCTAYCLCQICGTWSLSPWHSGGNTARPILWFLMSEFTVDFPFEDLVWCESRGLEQWFCILPSGAPSFPRKGVRDTEFLYPKLSPRLTFGRLLLSVAFIVVVQLLSIQILWTGASRLVCSQWLCLTWVRADLSESSLQM